MRNIWLMPYSSNKYVAVKGNIQPNIYRAPEVLFEMPWGFTADIWNVGPWEVESVL